MQGIPYAYTLERCGTRRIHQQQSQPIKRVSSFLGRYIPPRFTISKARRHARDRDGIRYGIRDATICTSACDQACSNIFRNSEASASRPCASRL